MYANFHAHQHLKIAVRAASQHPHLCGCTPLRYCYDSVRAYTQCSWTLWIDSLCNLFYFSLGAVDVKTVMGLWSFLSLPSWSSCRSIIVNVFSCNWETKTPYTVSLWVLNLQPSFQSFLRLLMLSTEPFKGSERERSL